MCTIRNKLWSDLLVFVQAKSSLYLWKAVCFTCIRAIRLKLVRRGWQTKKLDSLKYLYLYQDSLSFHIFPYLWPLLCPAHCFLPPHHLLKLNSPTGICSKSGIFSTAGKWLSSGKPSLIEKYNKRKYHSNLRLYACYRMINCTHFN